MLLYLIIPLVLVAAAFLFFNTRSTSGTTSVNKSDLLKPTTDKKKKNKKNKPEKKTTTASSASESEDASEAKLDSIDVAELYGLNKKKEVVVEQTESKKKATTASKNKATEQKSSKKQKEEDPTFQVVKRPELTGRKKDEKKPEPKVEPKKQKKDENKSIFKKFAETKKDESDEEQETKKKVGTTKQADSNSEGSDSDEEISAQPSVVEKNKEKRRTVVRDPYATVEDFWNSTPKEVAVEVVETKPKKAVEQKSTSANKVYVSGTSSSSSATWNQKEEGKSADESSFPKVG